MEITLHEILKIAGHQKASKDAKGTGNKFDEILQQTINRSSNSEAHAMALPPAQNISSIRFDLISNFDKAQNIKRVENFLDVLENYQEKLGDPTVTLKEIYPLVAHMESEIDYILPLLESLPKEDKMKNILNSTLITSTVEAIKFNRGDYL